MRELSGRLEEIPGEEAFPAYLESRIAAFYERAGRVMLKDGSTGSVTIGGTVSPAGGNFDEPVTQATLKVVGGFHGLSRARSDARRYPAIDPLDSWSHYTSVIEQARVEKARAILRKGNEVGQMMKVVGEEGTSLADFTTYLKAEFLDAVYLQQNAFSESDATTPVARQKVMFDIVEKALLGSTTRRTCASSSWTSSRRSSTGTTSRSSPTNSTRSRRSSRKRSPAPRLSLELEGKRQSGG